jgi:hypothetical protein
MTWSSRFYSNLLRSAKFEAICVVKEQEPQQHDVCSMFRLSPGWAEVKLFLTK